MSELDLILIGAALLGAYTLLYTRIVAASTDSRDDGSTAGSAVLPTQEAGHG